MLSAIFRRSIKSLRAESLMCSMTSMEKELGRSIALLDVVQSVERIAQHRFADLRVEETQAAHNMIPLEDNFTDIIGKAQRGLGFPTASSREKSGVPAEKIRALRDGNFDDEALAARRADP